MKTVIVSCCWYAFGYCGKDEKFYYICVSLCVCVGGVFAIFTTWFSPYIICVLEIEPSC